jgi:hypothetical protein
MYNKLNLRIMKNVLLLLIATVFVFSSCDKSDDPTPSTNTTNTDQSYGERLMNSYGTENYGYLYETPRTMALSTKTVVDVTIMVTDEKLIIYGDDTVEYDIIQKLPQQNSFQVYTTGETYFEIGSDYVEVYEYTNLLKTYVK